MDNENKLLGLLGGKSGESTGLPGNSCPLSGSSTSLNSQKEGSSVGGKKRSSGSLKDREGYGRYKTLDTYERLQGMSDQQIYYWIYRYVKYSILLSVIRCIKINLILINDYHLPKQ